ncbi:MAG: hypothetical protein Q9159_007154 [Coniocarpon cinnabarinum]
MEEDSQQSDGLFDGQLVKVETTSLLYPYITVYKLVTAETADQFYLSIYSPLSLSHLPSTSSTRHTWTWPAQRPCSLFKTHLLITATTMKWFRHPFSTKFIDGEMRLISDDSDGELPVYLHTGNTWLGDGDIERNKEDWIETVREHAPSNDEYGDGTRGAREDEGKERKPHAALIR